MRLFVTILYKPFGIAAGLLAGLLSKKLFDFLWARIDDAEPPKPTTEMAPLGKVLTAAAIQGVVFRTTRAAVDRYGAKLFHYVTGIWPGEREPDKAGIS